MTLGALRQLVMHEFELRLEIVRVLAARCRELLQRVVARRVPLRNAERFRVVADGRRIEAGLALKVCDDAGRLRWGPALALKEPDRRLPAPGACLFAGILDLLAGRAALVRVQ